jgi:stage V sporulation protein D (sporulation-specific penicillin-binding protein)
MDNERSKKDQVKIVFIFIMFVSIVLILAYKVFGIMFINNAEYQKEAYLQKTSEKTLSAKRGDIFDRNGEEFSISLTVSTFFLDPELIREVYGEYEAEGDIDKLFDYLVEKLGLVKDDLIAQLAYENNYRIIAKEISSLQADEIIAFRDEMDFIGLFREKQIKRYYPNGSLAAQVIGYTDSSQSGALGLELYYNSLLTGISGISIIEVDGIGQEIPFSDNIVIKPVDGNQIYMSIDKTIQLLAQNALKKAVADYKVLNGGCIIVMEPETGKILAMASYPDFDLNDPYGSSDIYTRDVSELTTEDIEYLMQYVWRNKAVSDTYEPGSTFKVITAAACLEEGAVSPDDVIDAAPITIDGWEIKHWMEDPPPYESFTNAMYTSSNPVFVRVSQLLGINLFYEYVRNFGFMNITGVALPAEANSIFKEIPTELDMAVNSFGQRFQITPIQLITAYCAIANGGYLLKPYIIEKIVDDDGKVVFEAEKNVVRQVISEETSDILKDILEGTVTYGTGKNAYVEGYRVAGKTGTSETLETDKGRYIASFAGFAPVDSPQVAVLVMLDYPSTQNHGGGYVAAPVAGRLIEDILVYLNVERNYTEYDLQIISKETTIPDVVDLDMDDAESTLQEMKLNYCIIGDVTSTVKRQVPEAGEVVSENPVVVIYSDDEEENVVRMSDLYGLSKDEALNKLKSLNLNVVCNGFGEVVSQGVKTGEMIEPGTIISIELREMEFANGD